MSSAVLSSCPDDELIDRFRAGEEQAFSLLVKRHMPMIKMEASRIGGGAEREDLLQEALLALLSAAVGYRQGSAATFATFARVCVHRRLVSMAVRFAKQMPDRSVDEQQEETRRQQEYDPAELLSRREDREGFERRLRALLTDREYRVLMLYLAAYSYMEIAQTLDIDRKAVDNAIRRAKRKLAGCLRQGESTEHR